MKVAIICPFDLNRLTGTPIRTKTTLRAVSTFAKVSVIATSGSMQEAKVLNVGKCNLITFTRRTLAALRAERPDVVHGITTVSVVPMILYKCMHPSVRIIFEMHGWAWFEQKDRGVSFARMFLLTLDYIGLWFANKVIVMSETQRAFLSRRTLGRSRIFVIWGPSEFEVALTDLPSATGIVAGYIGNSAWWQGLRTIIDAARILQGTSNISFSLAGFDASDLKEFPRLPNISYVGRVERTDVLNFLRSCDVLVSSRLKEGVSDLQYPQKLSEYLGAGRPVIVSGANDQPLIVQKAQCGIVADPMTAENLAEAIRTFARTPREERLAFCKRSLDFAKEHLVFDAFAKKVHAVYRS